MKHKIVLTGLMAATLACAIMLPELLEKTPSDQVADATVIEAEEDVELPVEVLIPIVAYEDAVGDPLLPEPLTLAQVAQQQALALSATSTVSTTVERLSVTTTRITTTSSISTTSTASDGN